MLTLLLVFGIDVDVDVGVYEDDVNANVEIGC